jgi:hypothetical protein
MKKFILSLCLVLVSGLAFGSWESDNNITNPLQGRIATNATAVSNYQNIQWSAPGYNGRNCVTDLTVGSNAGMTVNIIEGLVSGTTIYSLYVSSGIPLVEQWSITNPLCASGNAGLVISPALAAGVSPGTLVGTTYYINASGYVKGRP